MEESKQKNNIVERIRQGAAAATVLLVLLILALALLSTPRLPFRVAYRVETYPGGYLDGPPYPGSEARFLVADSRGTVLSEMDLPVDSAQNRRRYVLSRDRKSVYRTAADDGPGSGTLSLEVAETTASPAFRPVTDFADLDIPSGTTGTIGFAGLDGSTGRVFFAGERAGDGSNGPMLVRTLDPATRQVAAGFEEHNLGSFLTSDYWFAPDFGTVYYTERPGPRGEELRAYDFTSRTYEVLFPLGGLGGDFSGLELTPDGRHLIFMFDANDERDSGLYEYDLVTREPRQLLAGEKAASLSLGGMSPSGRFLWLQHGCGPVCPILAGNGTVATNGQTYVYDREPGFFGELTLFHSSPLESYRNGVYVTERLDPLWFIED